jgi:hypothetical protein
MNMTPILATLGFTDYGIIAWIVVTFAGGAAYATRQRGDLRRLDRKLDALLMLFTLPCSLFPRRFLPRCVLGPPENSTPSSISRTLQPQG